MQVKDKALGHRKKTVNQVVPPSNPGQFDNFLPWFGVDGRRIDCFTV